MKIVTGILILLICCASIGAYSDPIIFINHNVGFEREAGVYQSPTWIMFYGTDILLDGELMNPGDTIFVYCKCKEERCDEDKLVGAGLLIECPEDTLLGRCFQNLLLTTAIYYDDHTIDSLPNCPKAGDSLFFKVSNSSLLPYVRVAVESQPIFTWTQFGDRIQLYTLSTSCCTKRGDLTNDDLVDISDLMMMIDYMFLQGIAPECMESADVNGDESVDISDLMMMINFMFLNGPEFVPCLDD